MTRIEAVGVDAKRAVTELPEWAGDAALREAVLACAAVQRAAGEAELRERYRPDPRADEHVSPEALAELRGETARAPDDLVVDRSLSNCIAFNFGNVQGAVRSRTLIRARRRVDRLVAARLRPLFRSERSFWVSNSGHFWYPPGGFMGWHHNLRTPGWRLYVTWAAEPGRSFFRWCDPESGEIVTSMDTGLDVRLFEIAPERPLWHAVRSDTDRFSIGYRVMPPPPLLRRLRYAYDRFREAPFA